MKKHISIHILFIFTLLLLAACRSHQETTSSSSSETSEVTSTTQGAEATQVDYNGSYYSVEGKYDTIIIVNKKYPVAPDYAPGEDATALAAFQELVAAMQEEGFDVSSSYSGYRSYETQASLYQSYVDSDGQEAADRYSARPGYSEHQTGLAYDLLDSSGNLLTEENAANWLLEHAADYGFIVRYREDKEAITGYMAESWHVRYIGKEAADIAASGLTLEEYFGIEGGDYAE